MSVQANRSADFACSDPIDSGGSAQGAGVCGQDVIHALGLGRLRKQREAGRTRQHGSDILE